MYLFTAMKKAFCSAILFLIHLPLWAQTEKSWWNAGVSVSSFSYATSFAGHSFSASLSPSVGRFVAPNFLLGLGIPVGFSSSRYSVSTNKNFSIGLSPYSRYYFGTSSLKPFLGVDLRYEHLSLRSESVPAILSTTKGKTIGVSPSIGLAYFINRNVSLDVQLNYNWSRSTLTGTDNSGLPYNPKSSYTSKNASLTIGFNIFFGR